MIEFIQKGGIKMAKEKNIKTNAMRIIEKSGADVEIINYESDGFLDGVSIAAKLSQPQDQTFKTLVTKGKTDYFVCVVPVAEELDLKKAAKAFGEKSLEMIHVKDILKITGYVRGGCSPVGMKKQFRTVIDASAKNFEKIMFSGGRLGSQIRMSPNDLARIIDAQFAEITHR